MSLKNSILYLIKSQGEASYDEIYHLAEQLSHRPDNASRRARELTNEGLIEPIMAEAKSGVKYITAYRAL
jgi:hypothetical protein